MNLEELKAKLKRQLGSPSEANFSDYDANDATVSAINEYSKYRSIKVLDSLTTIMGMALYNLAKKERIMGVKEVFYSTGFDLTFDEWFPGVSDQWSPDAASISGRLEGISIFENPSIWTQYIQRLEQYQAMFDGTFEYDSQTKLLRLVPMPSSAGKIIPYIWTQRHTAETVPKEDIDDMLMWAKGMVKESMANKKSDQIRSVSGFGQSITMGTTYETLLKDANDLRDRFEKKFRGGIGIHIA